MMKTKEIIALTTIKKAPQNFTEKVMFEIDEIKKTQVIKNKNLLSIRQKNFFLLGGLIILAAAFLISLQGPFRNMEEMNSILEKSINVPVQRFLENMGFSYLLIVIWIMLIGICYLGLDLLFNKKLRQRLTI